MRRSPCATVPTHWGSCRQAVVAAAPCLESPLPRPLPRNLVVKFGFLTGGRQRRVQLHQRLDTAHDVLVVELLVLVLLDAHCDFARLVQENFDVGDALANATGVAQILDLASSEVGGVLALMLPDDLLVDERIVLFAACDNTS